jgi:hypothetical protein
MKFAQPYLFFALFALAIPVLVHLFNFRRFKRIPFTNVRFLREVRQDTKARNKLRNRLILLSRLLAVLFLVLAFTQPYTPTNGGAVKSGKKIVSFYLDNSFSMEAVGKNGTLLDEARKQAKEIALSYRPSDEFHVITNSFEGKHQRVVNREEFLELLEEVKSAPAVRKISEVTKRQMDILNAEQQVESGNKHVYLLSDFQKTTADFDRITNDTTVQYRLIPLRVEGTGNVSVDSIWFDSPVRQLNVPEAMHVRIVNHSDKNIENVPIRLYLNGEARSPASFSVAAKSSVDTTILFTIRQAGLQQGMIEINDYPITFDDRSYFSFDVAEAITVLNITPTVSANQSIDFVKTLFAGDSLFQYTGMEEGKVDFSAFSRNRLIVLNGLQSISTGMSTEIKRFLDYGGSLVVFPGMNADLGSYNSFLISIGAGQLEKTDTLRTQVDVLNFDHPLYRGVFEKTTGTVDLPVINEHYVIRSNSRSTQDEMMRLRNGRPFFASYKNDRSFVYLCAVPANELWSNFTRHALFVPTLYQVALFSQAQQDLFYTIGSTQEIPLSGMTLNNEDVFHLIEPTSHLDIIPAHRNIGGSVSLDPFQQISTPGNYLIKYGNTQVSGASFNYDRLESNLQLLTDDEIKTALDDSGVKNAAVYSSNTKSVNELLTETDFGNKWWTTCIWVLLLALVAEMLIIRFWKTSSVTQQSSSTP